jgi:pimeloyl-ACP methyl ester carboxylesterase
VTQRVLVLTPAQPKAAVILFTGGNGSLKLSPSGEFGSGKGNFLMRTRQQWADAGLLVAIVDAPSDRQSEPFLSGYRQTPEHVTDIKTVINWLREQSKLPIWLVGTSRGTQSIAWAATQLPRADGPDGLVLTSSILADPKSRSLPAMALDKLSVPVLLVHHREDACYICPASALPGVMEKLKTTRKALMLIEGGISVGDPCEAQAYHGYNGIEAEVVGKITQWILAP